MSEENSSSSDIRIQKISVVISGATRNFSDYLDFKKWHDEQWAKLGEYVQNSDHYRNDIRNRRNAVNNSLNTIDNQANQVNDGHFQDLVRHIEELYQVVYPTDTVRGAFLYKLSQENTRSAVSAFHYLVDWRITDTNIPDDLRGAVLAEMFQQGVLNKSDTINALEGAESDYRNGLAKAQEDFEALEQSLNDQIARAASLAEDANERARKYQEGLSQWADDFKRVSEERKDKLLEDAGKQRDNLKIEVEKLIETYDSKMALQWPTTYWQAKADKHKRAAFGFTWLFVGMSLLTLVITASLSLVLIVPIEDTLLKAFVDLLFPGGGYEYEPKDVSPFAKITAFGAILAIVIWILKLVARNMISHQHLATDAQERRVMILTYLSLLRRGIGMNDQELAIILSTIFRPSADGMVKEDGGPSPIPVEILKLLGKN